MIIASLDRVPVEYQPIENYGVIGDLRTVALVGMDGSIDFMSFPFYFLKLRIFTVRFL
ncbi:MAG: hypothetical protein ACREQW_22050 [Candidatus Binatia bacterium]